MIIITANWCLMTDLKFTKEQFKDWDRVFVEKGIYDFFLNECFKDNDDEERFVETRRDFVYIACVVAMQAKCGLIKMEVTPKRDSVSYPHKSWNEVVAKDAENFAIWNPVLKHYLKNLKYPDTPTYHNINTLTYYPSEIPDPDEIPMICISHLSNQGFKIIKNELMDAISGNKDSWDNIKSKVTWGDILDVINSKLI